MQDKLTKQTIQMACVFRHSQEIEYIPENLLLEIFKCLTVKDLCTIGRVCRKWRRVISDNVLWRHVDLRPYKLNLFKIWKVIRTHFSDVLMSLHLRGYMDPAGINWKKHSLSDAMLCELQDRCPNIKELELIQTNLTNVCCTGLPHNLQILRLNHCLFPQGWFEKISQNPCHKTLTCLDLSKSAKTSNVDFKDLSCLKSLTRLHLNNCYRVTHHGIGVIVDSYPGLEELCIAETLCDDRGLHQLSRGLVKLRRLDLSRCALVSDAGLGTLGACLSCLEWLQLRDCREITDRGLLHLFVLKQLVHCDVTGTKATEEGVKSLREKLSKCTIVYQTD